MKIQSGVRIERIAFHPDRQRKWTITAFYDQMIDLTAYESIGAQLQAAVACSPVNSSSPAWHIASYLSSNAPLNYALKEVLVESDDGIVARAVMEY